MNNRYIVINDSVSAHCCFEATVVDTSKPYMMHGKHYYHHKHGLMYETVCECFSIYAAEQIAKALNAEESL